MDEIYTRLDDEQTERQLLAGRLNMLFRDRRAHPYTCQLMETEARMSREAWARATDASDLVHGEVISLRTTVLGQISEIRELQAADRRRQTVILELLKIDHRRSTETSDLLSFTGSIPASKALDYDVDGDDEEGSSEDDEDDDMDIEADEEEHPAPADSGHVTALQAQITALQGQQGLAEGPTQPELPEEADSETNGTKTNYRSNADQETINTTSGTNAQLQAMIDQGVTAALAARDALRSTNGDDSHNSRTGVRRTERATHECTYIDFLKCQPLPFKGTKGVTSLSQWYERMESVFYISNCAVENQVKFATCTLHSVALTWWNTHVKTVGHEAAYGMPWKTLMKMMTEKYCPRNEIRKLEMELWDLKELALLCGRMFSEESDKIEKYIGGLPDMIHASVVASKPKMMQEAIEIATELMDKKIRTFAKRETVSKRKFENTLRNTQNQQQQSNKRQNTGRVYTAASGQKPTCYECRVQGHFKRECPKLKNNNNHGNQGGRNNAPARVYAVGRAGTDPALTS
nr:hypothetical protein [Tanacetum cinerariifolium]